MRRYQEGKLPVSKQQVLSPVCELGCLINDGVDEILAQVGIAVSIIRVAVSRVLVSVGAQAKPVGDHLPSLQTMRISVNGKQGEVVTETMLSR